MADNKKSIVLYCDWIEIFEKLKDAEAGQLAKHLFRYINDQNPKAPSRIVDISFELIKQQLKRDLKKYEKSIETKSLSGIVGNLKRWHPDLHHRYMNGEPLDAIITIANSRKISHTDKVPSQHIAPIADNVNGNDTVTDIKNILTHIPARDFLKFCEENEIWYKTEIPQTYYDDIAELNKYRDEFSKIKVGSSHVWSSDKDLKGNFVSWLNIQWKEKQRFKNRVARSDNGRQVPDLSSQNQESIMQKIKEKQNG